MNRIFSNQKGGTLLCYVPDDKAAPGIGAICALLKIKYREVGSEALDERIGALVSGKPQSAEAHRADAYVVEGLVVLSGHGPMRKVALQERLCAKGREFVCCRHVV